MTKDEWIERLRDQIEKLDADALAQRGFAKYQFHFPEDRAKTLRFAELLEEWADLSRKQLKHFEEDL